MEKRKINRFCEVAALVLALAALLTLIGTGLTERVHLGTWGGKTEAVAFLPISPVQGAALLLGGMLFAYLINNLKRGQGIFRVGFYLPVITSWVIVSLVFQYMFNNSNRGLINYILVDVLHILDDYVPWLLREWSGNAAIWLMGIWKNVGWSMLIYLAALQSIPKERYEAAELDGAGLWARFRYITMPSLRPTTFYVMVNMIIGSFNVFIQVMMLTGGNPNGKTSTLQYLLYDKAFNQFAFGEASAIGMISAVTIVILTVILNRTLKLNSTEQEG